MTQQQPIPSDWWKSYFSHHYGDLYRGPLADDLDTDLDLNVIASIFEELEGPFLDLGCGHGRHLMPLVEEDWPIFGIDYSADLVNMIDDEATREKVTRGDLKALPYQDNSIEGAYLLFNTFGYFSNDDNLIVLREIARVLKPGALLIMDAPARAGMRAVVRELPASVRCQGEMEIYETWSIDKETKRLLGQGTWKIAGDTKQWQLSLRLYTPVEIMRLFKKAGFSSEVEIRPLGEFDLLGEGFPAPELTSSKWKRATNMAILARR